ncbi:mitochondrial 37S ribosomal protein uS19m [Limtongia smithiae]|uniref:mitochondrial 37S ribosomal protein uS19m n=1 Tax=Limtongia smithiae TaxID=1125753 RepID=UPI0034CDDCF4
MRPAPVLSMRRTPVLLKRAAWKGPYVVPLPITQAKQSNTPIQTTARSCTILPSFVGLTFQVHNGLEFFSFKVTEEMVGYKLGEFVPTRKRFSFKGEFRR